MGGLSKQFYRGETIFSVLAPRSSLPVLLCVSCPQLSSPIKSLQSSAQARPMLSGVRDQDSPDRDYYDNKENDQGFINFDLKADLSPLFNWNVKALYMYLTAEYITEANTLNEMVLWDKIILNGEKMDLDLKSAKTKYYFRNDGKGLLAHKNVTLILNWNVQPNMGDLKWQKSKSTHSFEFPADYYAMNKKRRN